MPWLAIASECEHLRAKQSKGSYKSRRDTACLGPRNRHTSHLGSRRLIMARLSVRAWLSLSLATMLTTLLAAQLSSAAEAKSTQLPLKKIVLFSSGVGFFQHDG